jgi:hypothetical protein
MRAVTTVRNAQILILLKTFFINFLLLFVSFCCYCIRIVNIVRSQPKLIYENEALDYHIFWSKLRDFAVQICLKNWLWNILERSQLCLDISLEGTT